MRQDLYRITAVIAFSLAVGLLSGHLYFWLFIGLLSYGYWEYTTLLGLLHWMRSRKFSEPPHIPGVLEAMARQYDYLRDHHRKQKKKLASYLKRFKEATQALPDAVVVIGRNDEIVWANSKAGEYLGIRNPQDRGQRLVNLFRHPSVVNFMKETRDEGQQREKSLELVSPVNNDVHLELRVVSYGDSGKLLMARDITKIYRVTRMRTDFIANASHELRTPLTVISGYLESFEDGFADDEVEQTRARIRQMRKQTERMSRLIEDLLKLSTLETRETPGEREPVRLPDMLNSIIDEARAISGEQKHDFVVEVEPGLWIEGDRNQIYSAVSNVVINAVQHTPDQGKVLLRWYAVEEGAVFEVTDTGEGIDAEHIPRLTERFYRVDRGRSRDKGGTGLGLAIVKHILARHNARLEIESSPGAGSTFRFLFPANRVLRRDVIPART